MTTKSNVGIYLIQCTANQKAYIGQTSRLKNRWRDHLYRLRENKHENTHLQRIFNKYTEASLRFTVLCSLDPKTVSNHSPKQIKDVLTVLEQCYINIYKPEINQAPAAGSQLGYKHSKEALAKMSSFRKEYYKSGKAKKKPINPNSTNSREFKFFHAVEGEVKGKNLQQFCRDKNLNYSNLDLVKRGRIRKYKDYFRSKEDYLEYSKTHLQNKSDLNEALKLGKYNCYLADVHFNTQHKNENFVIASLSRSQAISTLVEYLDVEDYSYTLLEISLEISLMLQCTHLP